MYFIKDLPIEERPRERLKKYGVKALSNEELISILIRTGSKTKSVKELSYELLKNIKLHDLNNTDYQTIKNIDGIGEVKAMTIVSAIELTKRILNKGNTKVQIKTSYDVYNIVKEDMENELQEKLLVLYLDNRKHLIEKKIMFIGTVNQSRVHPRDIFREAVKLNSSSVIVVHNHPGGSILPSKEDVFLTNNLIKIGKLMEISVIDHLIIGQEGYYSFLEKNGDMFAR